MKNGYRYTESGLTNVSLANRLTIRKTRTKGLRDELFCGANACGYVTW